MRAKEDEYLERYLLRNPKSMIFNGKTAKHQLFTIKNFCFLSPEIEMNFLILDMRSVWNILRGFILIRQPILYFLPSFINKARFDGTEILGIRI